MFKVSFSDALAVAGIICGFVLVALDKAGKVKGPTVFGLLALAAILTVPLALGNSWVGSAPSGMARVARSALMLSLVGVFYSLLAVWVTQPTAPPPAEGFREAVPEEVFFSLGEHGLTTGASLTALTQGKSALLQLNGLVPVKFSLENGIIYCDVTIWGGPAGPPIQILRNELKVKPLHWDRNFSDRAVEVVDEHGSPIFQLIRKTPSHYVMNGVMPIPGGGFIVAPEQGPATMTTSPLPIIPPTLKPIFKYPSWKYPGQMVGP